MLLGLEVSPRLALGTTITDAINSIYDRSLNEAEQVVESLETRGVPVEYVLFPDEGHGFRKIPNRIRSTVAIVRWFTEYLRAGQP